MKKPLTENRGDRTAEKRISVVAIFRFKERKLNWRSEQGRHGRMANSFCAALQLTGRSPTSSTDLSPDPQIEGIVTGGVVVSIRAKVVLVRVKIESRLVRLGDSDPVVGAHTLLPPAAHHDHRSVTITIVAPETDPVARLDSPFTSVQLKPLGAVVQSAVLHRAAAAAQVAGPDCAVFEDSVAGDFGAEGFSAQTPVRRVQQRGVVRVVTARDLELRAADEPESWRKHVCVIFRIDCFADRGFLVVPVFTIVFHPILGVFIGEAGDQSPGSVGGRVAVNLKVQVCRI